MATKYYSVMILTFFFVLAALSAADGGGDYSQNLSFNQTLWSPPHSGLPSPPLSQRPYPPGPRPPPPRRPTSPPPRRPPPPPPRRPPPPPPRRPPPPPPRRPPPPPPLRPPPPPPRRPPPPPPRRPPPPPPRRPPPPPPLRPPPPPPRRPPPPPPRRPPPPPPRRPPPPPPPPRRPPPPPPGSPPPRPPPPPSPHFPPPAPPIDHKKLSFKLSFIWPEGYCKTISSGCENITTGLPDHFTINGFWPIYTDKRPDSTEQFSVDLVEDLKTDLEANWPNLRKFTKPAEYINLWDHEWGAHGTKFNLFSVHDYFDRSLQLFHASNVLQVLTQAGKPTKPEEVKKAFSGREPYVLCKEGSDRVSYFYQLVFCLNGWQQYENCPVPTNPYMARGHCPTGEDFSYGDHTTVTTTNGTLFHRLENLVDLLPI